MNQKQIGSIVLIIGILLAGFVFILKTNLDAAADLEALMAINETGTCITDEGKCLHKQYDALYIIGWLISGSLIILGIYLMFFDKTQKLLVEQNIRVVRALKEAKKEEAKKDNLTAFLSAFPDDERKLLRVIHDQEGIKQSTLRFKMGMSKSTLSILLTSLEERDIIARKEAGKTKEIFLRKKF
ncbi:MarR family transcriptional regulator [Candidatus Woesearchaeota archaeon]|nr:MarR family transcriptional regulator [Candidatus Woesearchaeota archaeon]